MPRLEGGQLLGSARGLSGLLGGACRAERTDFVVTIEAPCSQPGTVGSGSSGAGASSSSVVVAASSADKPRRIAASVKRRAAVTSCANSSLKGDHRHEPARLPPDDRDDRELQHRIVPASWA